MPLEKLVRQNGSLLISKNRIDPTVNAVLSLCLSFISTRPDFMSIVEKNLAPRKQSNISSILGNA
jgi:hypothetical protein